MSTTTIENTKSKRPVAIGAKAKASLKARSTPAVAKAAKPTEAQREERVTKQERLLTLLSQREGASIECRRRNGSSTACVASWQARLKRSSVSR
jgi:hypothetical protein